eukprot:364159-Chlamydomonas_euryale.AAC.3
MLPSACVGVGDWRSRGGARHIDFGILRLGSGVRDPQPAGCRTPFRTYGTRARLAADTPQAGIHTDAYFNIRRRGAPSLSWPARGSPTVGLFYQQGGKCCKAACSRRTQANHKVQATIDSRLNLLRLLSHSAVAWKL